MKHRFITSAAVLACVIGVATLTSTLVAGQAPAAKAPAAAKAFAPPRTVDGKPDLQGVWDYRSITPLEKPAAAGDKTVYTDEEAAALQETAQARNQDNRDGAGTNADVGRAYNDFWWDFGKTLTTKRTSLIVDPPDGRIPALTPEAQARGLAGRGGGGGGRGAAPAVAAGAPAAGGARGAGVAAAGAPAAAAAGGGFGGGQQRIPESWLDRSTWERCLTFGAVPRLSGAYNNNFRLIQSKDYLVLTYEMIHESRIIPLDGRPHGNLRQWLGDSRGHWEGDTLVVDTINFSDRLSFRGSNTNLHLIERFTRDSANTIQYEFTVNDPTVWTKPWTAQVPVTKNPEEMYEYACHEGNYGMFGILTGARSDERAAAAAAQKGSR